MKMNQSVATHSMVDTTKLLVAHPFLIERQPVLVVITEKLSQPAVMKTMKMMKNVEQRLK